MQISRERVLEAIAAELNRQTAGGSLPAYALDREAMADAVMRALDGEPVVENEGKRPEELNAENDD
jgi:hypothetical protein